jgi:hypothetical protein
MEIQLLDPTTGLFPANLVTVGSAGAVTAEL